MGKKKDKKDKKKDKKDKQKDKKKASSTKKSSVSSASSAASSNASSKASKSKASSKSTSKASAKSKSKATSKSKSKATSKKSSCKSAFSANAESISPANDNQIKSNQQQIDMIVGLLEGVRTDFVTRHNKDDLDRIQMLVKNITYREAGEDSKVVKVHYTPLQKVVIKKVCGKNAAPDDSSLSGGASIEDSELSVNSGKNAGYVPKITYPFVKLTLVATRLSTQPKKKKKK